MHARVATNPELADAPLGELGLRNLVHIAEAGGKPHRASRSEPRQREVFCHGHLGHEPQSFAIFGYHDHTGVNSGLRRAETHGSPVDAHAPFDFVERTAEERREQRGAA